MIYSDYERKSANEAARAKANNVIAKLRAQRLAKAAELVEANVAETLTYYGFPDQHWR